MSDAWSLALLIGLRDPLCTAELAASQLERESVGPARELVQTIRAAIADADGRIDRLSRRLEFAAASTGGHVVSALAAEVVDRVGPALAARGIEVTCAAAAVPVTTAEPELVRRTLLALLRFASSLPAPPRRVELAWPRRAEQLGLRALLDPQPTSEAVRAALSGLRGFAEREGIALEIVTPPDDAAVEVVAWLSASPVAS